MPGREIHIGFYNKSVYTPHIYQVGFLLNIIRFILAIMILKSNHLVVYSYSMLQCPSQHDSSDKEILMLWFQIIVILIWHLVLISYWIHKRWRMNKGIVKFVSIHQDIQLNDILFAVVCIRREFHLYFWLKSTTRIATKQNLNPAGSSNICIYLFVLSVCMCLLVCMCCIIYVCLYESCVHLHA